MKKTFGNFSGRRGLPPAGIVDVLGPAPLVARDHPAEIPDQSATPEPILLRLKPGTPQAITGLLLRYVSDFGQGVGAARNAGGEWLIELASHQDAAMVTSQFSDLLVGKGTSDGSA